MLIGGDFTIDQKRFQAPSAPESEWLIRIMRPIFDYDHNHGIENFDATNHFFLTDRSFCLYPNRVQKIENNLTMYVA
jgi:hypothetical protein